MGSEAAEAARRWRKTLFWTAGLTLGTRRWRALEAAAACVGGRALNSREQATCTGCMDLQTSLLSTGPNASNISDGQDNLTLAGESSWSPPSSGMGVENGKVSPPKPNCLGNFILQFLVIRSAVCFA